MGGFEAVVVSVPVLAQAAALAGTVLSVFVALPLAAMMTTAGQAHALPVLWLAAGYTTAIASTVGP